MRFPSWAERRSPVRFLGGRGIYSNLRTAISGFLLSFPLTGFSGSAERKGYLRSSTEVIEPRGMPSFEPVPTLRSKT
jgi:hypothetical protein